jgi:hypothetical protein
MAWLLLHFNSVTNPLGHFISPPVLWNVCMNIKQNKNIFLLTGFFLIVFESVVPANNYGPYLHHLTASVV